MRDYARLAEVLRCCGQQYDCTNCPYERHSDECKNMFEDAADAIEELQNQVVDLNKMVPEWISVEEVTE